MFGWAGSRGGSESRTAPGSSQASMTHFHKSDLTYNNAAPRRPTQGYRPPSAPLPTQTSQTCTNQGSRSWGGSRGTIVNGSQPATRNNQSRPPILQRRLRLDPPWTMPRILSNYWHHNCLMYLCKRGPALRGLQGIIVTAGAQGCCARDPRWRWPKQLTPWTKTQETETRHRTSGHSDETKYLIRRQRNNIE